MLRAVETEDIMTRHLNDSLLLTRGAFELSQNQIAEFDSVSQQRNMAKLGGI